MGPISLSFALSLHLCQSARSLSCQWVRKKNKRSKRNFIAAVWKLDRTEISANWLKARERPLLSVMWMHVITYAVIGSACLMAGGLPSVQTQFLRSLFSVSLVFPCVDAQLCWCQLSFQGNAVSTCTHCSRIAYTFQCLLFFPLVCRLGVIAAWRVCVWMFLDKILGFHSWPSFFFLPAGLYYCWKHVWF